MEKTGMSATVDTAEATAMREAEISENATQGRVYGENSHPEADAAKGDSAQSPDGGDNPREGSGAATQGYDGRSEAEDGALPTEQGADALGEGRSTASEKSPTDGEIDYGELMRRDLDTLKATFPELAGLNDIADMRGALRYAALRDLGLTAEEAYMAASAPRVRRDNRAHLSAPIKGGASTAMVGMSQGELHTARELFSGMTDADIYNLYKRVSK